jgi:hypothetical protein
MESRNNLLSSRAARIVFLITAATSLGAAVAAAPSEPARMAEQPPVVIKTALGDSATKLRPFGPGPAILVGRAYDAEDEDCTVAITRITDRYGRVHVTRGIACAN